MFKPINLLFPQPKQDRYSLQFQEVLIACFFKVYNYQEVNKIDKSLGEFVLNVALQTSSHFISFP